MIAVDARRRANRCRAVLVLLGIAAAAHGNGGCDGGGTRDDAAAPDGGCDAGPVGEGCRSDAPCADGERCVRDDEAPAVDLEPLSLVCARPPPGASAGQRCEASEECARGLCAAVGVCVAPCAADADCGSEQVCVEVWVRSAEEAMQPVRACVPRFALPPDARAVQAHLPDALGADGRGAIALTAVEGGALYVLEPDCGDRLSARRLETAERPPRPLFDADALRPGATPPLNPVALGSHPLTLLVPNGPAAPHADEGYLLHLEASEPGGMQRTRIERSERGSVLDLDVFYVGVRGWAPTGDRGPDGLARALDIVERIYEPAGLRLGEVRQHALVGELARRYAIVDREVAGSRHPEAEALLRLSAGKPSPSVSVFFVRSIDMRLGLSGGAPGPQGMPTTAGSGIVMAAEELGEDLGRALAHELGHFLGLFHVTESDGRVLDPLPDTPVCELDRDADGDGILDAVECEGAGADNLMFWTGDGTRLSAEQQEVLARAIVLRQP